VFPRDPGVPFTSKKKREGSLPAYPPRYRLSSVPSVPEPDDESNTKPVPGPPAHHNPGPAPTHAASTDSGRSRSRSGLKKSGRPNRPIRIVRPEKNPGFRNRIAMLKFSSRSRSRLKTVPEKSIRDFHFAIDLRFCDRNRSAIFILRSDRD
jgi:hypothetical protein